MKVLQQSRHLARIDQKFTVAERELQLSGQREGLDRLHRWADASADPGVQERLGALQTLADNPSDEHIRSYAKQYGYCGVQLVPHSSRTILRLYVETFAGQWNNLYLLDTEPKRTLIDAGSSSTSSTEQLGQCLDVANRFFDVNASYETIGTVIVTHAHIDHHSGLNHILAQNPFIEVIAHRHSARKLAHHDTHAELEALETQRLTRAAGCDEETVVAATQFMLQANKHFQPIAQVHSLDEGDEVANGLKVLHCPGHQRGQIVLYDDEVMFAADLVIPTSHTPMTPLAFTPDGGVDVHLYHLRRLLAISPRTLLSGHGPILDNHHPRTEEAIAAHEQTLHRLCRLLEEPRTVAQVMQAMHKGRIRNLYYQMAVLEDIYGHIEYLGQLGLARVVNVDAMISGTEAAQWQLDQTRYDASVPIILSVQGGSQ